VFGFLLALAILDGLLLAVVVLLQSGKGDGLAAMGGAGGTMADSILGGRQAATLLTKATWITGGAFLSLLFILSVMSSRVRAPQPLLRDQFPTQQQPQPLVPQPGAPTTTAPPPGQAPPPTSTTNR
jgi:preprotein translocase subunit SecG